MAPAELKKLHIDHFEQLLVLECNPLRRAIIRRLLVVELAKPDTECPSSLAEGADEETVH